MLSIYTAELFKRVFYPTTRGADYVSILIPLAVAATAYFSGVKVSENTTTQVLAYVGVFTLLTFSFRLMVSAPYSMWKEKATTLEILKAELAKPERAVLEHLARHRAKARAKLCSRLEDIQTCSFASDWPLIEPRFVKQTAEARRLQAEAGLSSNFEHARRIFIRLVKEEGNSSNETLNYNSPSNNLLKILQRHLVGDLTSDDLERLLVEFTD